MNPVNPVQTLRFSVSQIHQLATKHPPAYIDDVLARSTREGDTLLFTPENYLFLLEQYAPEHHAQAKSILNPSVAIPREKWPMWARTMALLSRSGDTGLGDIIARTIGPIGGDAYKSWYQAIFHRPCGCTERQETLNAHYPLNVGDEVMRL